MKKKTIGRRVFAIVMALCVIMMYSVTAFAVDGDADGQATCTLTCENVEDGHVHDVDCYAHTWNDGEVTKDATCLEEGEKTYTCTVCEETKTEAIDKTDHAWNEGEVTTEATCSAEGEKTYTCTVEGCGATKTESIPMTAHTYDNDDCTECSAKNVYVSASGDDSNAGTADAPFATLKKAVETAKSGTTIYVLSDLTMSESARFYSKDLTLTSKGGTYTVTRAADFETTSDNARSWYNPAMIEVQVNTKTPKASLTVMNLVIDDAGLKAPDATMLEGPSTAPNNDGKNLTRVQSAIIESTPAGVGTTIITLGDGAVLKNYGGMSAVRITSGATVTMNSGSKICDEKTVQRTINKKTATAAVWNIGATFVMNDGAVIEDINGGSNIFVSNGKSNTIIGGEIRNCSGTSHVLQSSDGAVGNAPYVELTKSGNVHDNSFSSSGALYMNTTGDILDIYGSVCNNVASDRGGAVAMQNGTDHVVNMYDGALIDGNETLKESAGGVLVGRGTFTMYGGTISNNKATANAKGYGGGVYVRDGGVFQMLGGTIEKNTAKTAGGGIAFDGDKKTKGSNAILKGGTITDNSQKNGDESNDIAVTNEKKADNESSNIDQNLMISDKVVLGNEKIYYEKDDYMLEATRGIKQGSTNAAAKKALGNASAAKGWGNVLATLWRQSKVADLTFSEVEFDSSLPVYAIELDADANGNAIAGTEKVYTCKVAGAASTRTLSAVGAAGTISTTLLASGDNGTVVALVQPTKDNGEVVLTTPEKITKSDAASYEVPFTVEYTMSDSLFNELKETDGTGAANVTVELDSRLTDGTVKTVESEIFELDSQKGTTVTLKLKNGWKNAKSMTTTIKGTSTLPADKFAKDDYLVSKADAEVTVTADDKRTVPGNVAKTLMVEPEKKPDEPNPPVNPPIVDPAGVGTVTYTDGVADEEIFADQIYTGNIGDATPSFVGTPEREGYEFVGWTPEVSPVILTDSDMYTAVWKILDDDDDINGEAHGNGNKPIDNDSIDSDAMGDKEDIDADAKGVKTGDTTAMIPWALAFGTAVMLLCGAFALRRREE